MRFRVYELEDGELAKRDLSEKARRVIDETDPCGIAQTGENHFVVFGEWAAEGTLEEVEKTLEDIYDEYFTEEE